MAATQVERTKQRSHRNIYPLSIYWVCIMCKKIWQSFLNCLFLYFCDTVCVAFLEIHTVVPLFNVMKRCFLCWVLSGSLVVGLKWTLLFPYPFFQSNVLASLRLHLYVICPFFLVKSLLNMILIIKLSNNINKSGEGSCAARSEVSTTTGSCSFSNKHILILTPGL